MAHIYSILVCMHFTYKCTLEVGGIDKFSTMVFLETILRYNYVHTYTTGVADLQAPLNNMLRSS